MKKLTKFALLAATFVAAFVAVGGAFVAWNRRQLDARIDPFTGNEWMVVLIEKGGWTSVRNLHALGDRT